MYYSCTLVIWMISLFGIIAHLCTCISNQLERQSLNLHEVAMAVVVDTAVVVVVLVEDTAETLQAMETHMAIGRSLLRRVHLTRVMESLMRDEVAMEHPVVLSVVAGEAVTAMEKLEKKWSALVGHLSAVVEPDVGMYGVCCDISVSTAVCCWIS